MENILLREAKKLYPQGTLFYSASGLLKNPMKVSGLRMSSNYKNVVVNASGGLVYDNGWAKKI